LIKKRKNLCRNVVASTCGKIFTLAVFKRVR